MTTEELNRLAELRRISLWIVGLSFLTMGLIMAFYVDWMRKTR